MARPDLVKLSFVLTAAARQDEDELEKLLDDHEITVTARGRSTLTCRTELSNFETLFDVVGDRTFLEDQTADTVESESYVPVPPFLTDYVSTVAVEPTPTLMQNAKRGEEQRRGDAWKD